MPNFKLDAINYVVTGRRQKILNLDFTDDAGLPNNGVSFFTDNEAGTYELSALSSNFSYDPFSSKNRNEHGFVFMDDPSILIRALYDFKDVALKSAVAERITNKPDESEPDDNIEMYMPHLRENPLGFVQLKHYSYGMTDKTVIGPVIRRTDLFEQRSDVSSNSYNESFSSPTWEFFLNPYDKEGSTQIDPGWIENLIPTFLYTPRANLSSVLFNRLSTENAASLDDPELSAETLSSITSISIDKTKSYFDFLTYFGKDLSGSVLSSLFKPVYNFKNIGHNYIMEVPLLNPQVDNQYHFGVVNADMIMAKNVYDDIYNTNVSSVGDFRRIRSYQSINTGGDKMFLTYFDDREYVPSSEDGDGKRFDKTYEDYDENGTEDVREIDETPEKNRDYMKIECIDAINRFISTTVHKANVYSTNVYGLAALLEDPKYDSPEDAYRESIKRDIKNSVRRIVTNFVPAHTQYFDVVKFEKNKDQEFC